MTDITSAIEAILFASGDSIPVARLSLVLGAQESEILSAAQQLRDEYEREGRGIRLLILDDKLQLCSSPEYAQFITKALEQRKPPVLSQSALETLAVVAYYQPVTRAYIDQVRGVDSSYTVSTLIERGLIAPAGRLEAPGRPITLKTTDVFLRTMCISSLDELPELPNLATTEGTEQLRRKIEQLQRAESGEQIILEEITDQSSGE